MWQIIFGRIAESRRDPTSSEDDGAAAFKAATTAVDANASYGAARRLVSRMAEEPDFRFPIELLKRLHAVLGSYMEPATAGTIRRFGAVVFNESTGDTNYQAPDAGAIAPLLDELMAELNGPSDEPAVVRAAMAHLNVTLIHPFQDGNGRLARCLHELVLLRSGWLADAFCSLDTYVDQFPVYYQAVLRQVAGRGESTARRLRSKC